jgi:hypothetical protein
MHTRMQRSLQNSQHACNRMHCCVFACCACKQWRKFRSQTVNSQADNCVIFQLQMRCGALSSTAVSNDGQTSVKHTNQGWCTMSLHSCSACQGYKQCTEQATLLLLMPSLRSTATLMICQRLCMLIVQCNSMPCTVGVQCTCKQITRLQASNNISACSQRLSQTSAAATTLLEHPQTIHLTNANQPQLRSGWYLVHVPNTYIHKTHNCSPTHKKHASQPPDQHTLTMKARACATAHSQNRP